jgi:hypothetical protein
MSIGGVKFPRREGEDSRPTSQLQWPIVMEADPRNCGCCSGSLFGMTQMWLAHYMHAKAQLTSEVDGRIGVL